jgi:hypothetical protein
MLRALARASLVSHSDVLSRKFSCLTYKAGRWMLEPCDHADFTLAVGLSSADNMQLESDFIRWPVLRLPADDQGTTTFRRSTYGVKRDPHHDNDGGGANTPREPSSAASLFPIEPTPAPVLRGV